MVPQSRPHGGPEEVRAQPVSIGGSMIDRSGQRSYWNDRSRSVVSLACCAAVWKQRTLRPDERNRRVSLSQEQISATGPSTEYRLVS